MSSRPFRTVVGGPGKQVLLRASRRRQPGSQAGRIIARCRSCQAERLGVAELESTRVSGTKRMEGQPWVQVVCRTPAVRRVARGPLGRGDRVWAGQVANAPATCVRLWERTGAHLPSATDVLGGPCVDEVEHGAWRLGWHKAEHVLQQRV